MHQGRFKENLADRLVGADNVAVMVGVEGLENLIEQLFLVRRNHPFRTEIHTAEWTLDRLLTGRASKPLRGHKGKNDSQFEFLGESPESRTAPNTPARASLGWFCQGKLAAKANNCNRFKTRDAEIR